MKNQLTYPHFAIFYKEEPLPGEEMRDVDFQTLQECLDFKEKLDWGFIQINQYNDYESPPIVVIYGSQYGEA